MTLEEANEKFIDINDKMSQITSGNYTLNKQHHHMCQLYKQGVDRRDRDIITWNMDTKSIQNFFLIENHMENVEIPL